MADNYSEVAMPTSDALHPAEATAFLTTVFGWMFGGLLLTTAVAGVVANSERLIYFIFGNRMVFYGLLIAEILLVIVLSAAVNKISAGVATALFLLYSALNGATLSSILLLYTGESVMMAFGSAACLFGTMALYGYVTKRDLTSWGNLLLIGLIAVIVCSIINLFLASSGFEFVISIVGVVIFLGLTAYDTQKVLRFGADAARLGPSEMRKGAILGALALYLDFINLFLYMLRFMGKKK